MRTHQTVGQICLDDDLGLTYYVARIEYCEREDESYCYTFVPNYSVIDLLSSDFFQGIPGLDLSLRKEEYVRENITPVFISERTPAENREDLWELLTACNMEYLNRLEWLIRTDLRYSGDLLYVSPIEEKRLLIVDDVSVLDSRSAGIMRKLLEIICSGGIVSTSDCLIDDSNRKQFYSLLKAMYVREKSYIAQQKKKGIEVAVAEGKYRGRGKIPLDDTILMEVMSAYECKKITGEEAARRLQVSLSTFNRRYKASKEK